MTVTSEDIKSEIKWYNEELVSVKDKLESWLIELGYKVTVSEIEVIKNEGLSGPYKAKQFDFIIDDTLKISLLPSGIWLIGAKGRIDISGPSGSEKLLFFFSGGPGMTNIDEENWYWYDDSSYRKVVTFSKEIVQPLLERLQ